MKLIKKILYNPKYLLTIRDRVNEYDLEQLQKWEEENKQNAYDEKLREVL